MRLEGEPLYNFTLESVIVHHAEAVSSVTWDISADHKQGQALRLKDLILLSSSFDFSVCLWHADEATEVWHVESTLGAMVGNKHAFFGAIFLSSTR